MNWRQLIELVHRLFWAKPPAAGPHGRDEGFGGGGFAVLAGLACSAARLAGVWMRGLIFSLLNYVVGFGMSVFMLFLRVCHFECPRCVIWGAKRIILHLAEPLGDPGLPWSTRGSRLGFSKILVGF